MKSRIIAVAALSLAGCAPSIVDQAPQRDSVNATLSQYRTWIAEARQRYPYADSEQRMIDVMMCTSGGDASKVNQAGTYSGLFQYSDEAWKGDWNDYRGYNMLKPKVQIFATALAWQKNMQHQWGCYSVGQTGQRTQALTIPAPAPAPAPAMPAPVVTQPAPTPTPPVAPVPRVIRSGTDEGTMAQYRTWITEARSRHPYADSGQRMFDVMMCESGGKASIVNPQGPYSGLFQYSSGTWKGAWNDYRSNSVLDARAQIFATAQAWQKNMQRQWGCYTRAH